MKKLSLVLLGALATVQVAQAAPGSFNGFYVGGQLGWTQRSHKADADESIPQEVRDTLKKSRKINGMTYGIYTGYGQNNSGFYWGGEFGIEHSTANKELKCDYENKEDMSAGGVLVLRAGNNVKVRYTYQRGVVFSLAPRLGAVIDNNNLIYAKLGMELSRDTIKVKKDNDNSNNKSKTNFVFVPGIGYERAFSGHLLARVEYGYNIGGKIKFDCATYKYSAHILKVGLAYKF